MKPLNYKNRCLQMATIGILLAAASWSARADYSDTVLAKNPKGYWHLNETVPVPTMASATNYGSATAADGAYLNAATTIPSPIANAAGETAVKFDGVSQRIQLPYNADLNPASALSVEAWVRPLTTTNVDSFWYRAVVRSGGQNWGGGYMLQYNALAGSDAGIFKFTLFNSSGGFEIYNTNFMGNGSFNIFATNNVWFHMVGTWSSTDNKGHLYVNGIEMTNMNPGTVGGVTYTPTATSFLRIGADDTSPTSPWGNHLNPGGTAHVAVYNTQLSPAQILAHYQAGISASSNYAATVLADSPVGYWKLNESTFPALPVAVNQGSAGSTLDGLYCFASTPGVAGPQPPNYTGLQATNTGVFLTNTTTGIGDGGYMLFPALRNKTDTTNFTIAALIKIKGTQLPVAAILGRRMIGSQKAAFGFDNAGTGLGYNWDDVSSQYNYSSGFKPIDGVWTLAAVVMTSSNTVVYMDNGSGLQASTNNVANIAADAFAYPCYAGALGGNYANSTRGYNGSIDELAVWTNSLSRQDILDLREAWIGSGLFLAQQPSTRQVMLGGKAKFSCTPAGSTNYMPFSYQLKKNGSPIGPVSASSTLFITNVQPADLTSSYTINILTNGVVSGLTTIPGNLQRVTIPGTYSALIESYQPDAYYRFNETSPGTVYDLANLLDGTTNALTSSTAGPNAADGSNLGMEAGNTGYAFNGGGGGGGGFVTLSGSGIKFPDPTVTKTTISLWIYPTGTQTAYSGIYYSRATDYCSLEFGPSPNTTELGVAWASGNGNYNTHSGVFVYPGTWNFVAMVVTNDGATFYAYSVANGWQSNRIAGTFAPNRNMTGGTGTCIGTDPNTGLNRGIKGSIDEVAVFSKIMSCDDVQKLAYAGTQVHVGIERASADTYNVGWSDGTLQWADSLFGPWTDVPGAAGPSVLLNATAPQKFFRAAY